MSAVPAGYTGAVDTAQVKKVFPYGVCSLDIVEGGGLFSSGIALPGARRAPNYYSSTTRCTSD